MGGWYLVDDIWWIMRTVDYKHDGVHHDHDLGVHDQDD